MALQVWLPLNGNLDNLGLSNITVTNNGATVNDNGKIGKCYLFGTSSSYLSLPKEAMTSFTTEASVCFWLKINTFNTAWATYFQAGTGSTPWTNYIFGFLRNSSASTCCFAIGNGTTSSQTNYLTPSLSTGIWYHIGLIYKSGHCLIYLNGDLHLDFATTYTVDFSKITHITLGKCNNGTSYQTDCLMNDVRIYNHALSPKEIKEISKGLVLHYELDTYIGKNLVNNCKDITTGWGKYAGVSSLTYENGRVKAEASSSGSPRIYNSTILPYASEREYYTIYIDYTSSSNINITGKSSNSSTTLNESGSLLIGTISKLYEINLGNDHKIVVFSWYRLAETDTIKAPWWMISFSVNTTLYINAIKVEKGLNNFIVWSPYNVEYSTIYDSSGYNNNAQIIGNNLLLNNTSDTPRYNYSLTMNNTGTSNHIEANPIGVSDNIFTVSFWVKSSKSSNQVFIADPKIVIGTLNSLLYVIPTSSTPFTTTNFINNDWNHIAVVRNTSTYKVYINGKLETQNGASNYYAHTATKLYLLNRSYNNYYAANASISDIRVYSSELSEDDILELYNTSAVVDNQGNDYAYLFNELIESIELNLPLNNFNRTSGSMQFDGKDLVFTGTSSSYSDYIEVDVSKTLFYDITYSNTSGSWFLIGFERFDENKTPTSNNGCVYIMTTTSEVDHKRITGTVTLSNINGNVCKFTRIRILNCWTPLSTITGGVGKIHSFHFIQINGTGDSKIDKQGRFTTGWFMEDKLLQSLISKNKYVTANQLIEI